VSFAVVARNARVYLVGVVVAALLVGFISPTAPANAAPPAANTRDSVPVIDSPVREALVSTFPEGEFEVPDGGQPLSEVDEIEAAVSAEVADGGFSPLHSELVRETEFTQVFQNPDGTRTARLSAEPERVLSDGEWKPVSTTLVPSREGVLAIDDHPLSPRFALSSDDDELFSVSRNGHDVSFSLREARDSPASRTLVPRMNVGRDQVEYKDVFPDVDLEYVVSAGSVKETLILRDVPSAGDSSWTWDVDAPGLKLRMGEYGEVEFLDKAGRIHFTMPTPYMWDSSGVEGVQEPAMELLDTSVAETSDGWSITVSAKHSWLAASGRVYPVYVDPTLGVGGTNIVAYKSDGAVLTGVVRVGNSRDGGTNKFWRSVVHYPYSSLAGTQLVDGVLAASYANAGTTSTYTGGVYTAQCYGYTCASSYLTSLIVGTSGQTGSASPLASHYAGLVNNNSWTQAL